VETDVSMSKRANRKIVDWLHSEFYTHGQANSSHAASSHWAEFSRQFNAQRSEGGTGCLKGYGFGDLEKGGLANRLFASASTSLLGLAHRNLELADEVSLCKSIVAKMELSFSQDAFRQSCTLHLIKGFVGSGCEEIVIIGDGYGVLAALLHYTFPKARITLIDLGAVLFFQAVGLARVFPDESFALRASDTVIGDEAAGMLRFVPAESIPTTCLNFGYLGLAVNIASMQEMNPEIVAGYFHLLRQNNAQLFYCCNRLEKILPDGQVSALPSYPWLTEDEHLIDEPCPWHQWFVGLPPIGAANHKWGSLPLPFLHKYDGTHWHRLTRLAQTK